jgi:hypothetical protein
LASEMCELEPRSEPLTRRLLEGGRKGEGREGGKQLRHSSFLSSFSGLHAGRSQQGQRPKTVEANIHYKIKLRTIILLQVN